ncbi:MAG: diguanylate cyclase [Desulfotalea sp.]
MKSVLLVEDSQMFGRLAKSKIEAEFEVPVVWTKTLAMTKQILESSASNFSAALLDFNLPDAPQGEVIDEVLSYGITSFVFTSNMTEEVRELVWSKKVADYILKEDPNSLDYIINAMRQVEKNQDTLVLIVDDSITSRTLLSELLYVRKFRVINATNGADALGIIDNYPEIKLVITDYNMPKMNGYVLCQKIRERYKADRMAIIGISSEEDRSIGARFIKSGANDFVVKQSFLVEEFYSRVKDCLETIELFSKIRYTAMNDYLTGLFNRRHFFHEGNIIHQRCRKKCEQLSFAILDIDHFKNINDSYGHDLGDVALQNIANLLKENASESEIIARFGGEEFVILTPYLAGNALVERFETLRLKIETTPIATLSDGKKVSVTCSFGVCSTLMNSLDEMIKIADNNLYKAKNDGRNRVVIS